MPAGMHHAQNRQIQLEREAAKPVDQLMVDPTAIADLIEKFSVLFPI